MSIKFMKDTDVLETIHGHTGNIFKDNIPSEFTELSEQAQEYKKPADTGQKWWKQKFTKDILLPLNNKNNFNIHSDKIAGPRVKELDGLKSLTINSPVVYIKKNFKNSESNRLMCMAFEDIDIIKDDYSEIVSVYNQLNSYSKTENINTINIQSHLSVIIYEPKPPVSSVRGRPTPHRPTPPPEHSTGRRSTIKKPLQFINDPNKFIYFYKTHKNHGPRTPYIDSIIYIPIYALNYDIPSKSIIYFDKQITDTLFPQEVVAGIPEVVAGIPEVVAGIPEVVADDPKLQYDTILASSNPYDMNQYLHIVSFDGIKGKFLQGRSKFDIRGKTQFNLYSYETKHIAGVIEYSKEYSEGDVQSVNIKWCTDYDIITT